LSVLLNEFATAFQSEQMMFVFSRFFLSSLLCVAITAPNLAAKSKDAADEGMLNKSLVRSGMGERLDQYLERASKFGFSGTVLVADTNGVVLHKGYGWSDKNRGKRNSVNTIYDMGSMAKALTATAILTLEEEGKLQVTDLISNYFEVPTDKKEITLHQLLTHTSGLVSDVGNDYENIPKDLAIARMFASPLVSEPGKAFNYSNVGFSLLAALIEKVTGEPYESYMRRKFFLPNRMNSTGYRQVKWKASVVAHNYSQNADLGSPWERLLKANGPSWNLMGNGGLLTTAADVYRWELGLRSNKILSAKQQAKQFSPQFRRSPALANGYDWWIEDTDWDAATAFHRGGDSPDYALNAEFRRYPPEKVTIILLANNRLNGWSSRRYIVPAIRKIMLGREQVIPPKVMALRKGKLQPLEGRYAVEPGQSFDVAMAGDHLSISAVGQKAIDALTFSRVPSSQASRRRLNARAEDFFSALQSENALKVAPFVEDGRAQQVFDEWRELVTEHQGFMGAMVLGTSRLDRGQFLTAVKLQFKDSWVTVRFCWTSNKVTSNSDDGTFPSFTSVMRVSPVDAGLQSSHFWSTGTPGDFVIHDLLTGQTLKLRFEHGAMIILQPDGELKAEKTAL
jgi:CubicO group peptidase (beta-lactamase class C family)